MREAMIFSQYHSQKNIMKISKYFFYASFRLLTKTVKCQYSPIDIAFFDKQNGTSKLFFY